MPVAEDAAEGRARAADSIARLCALHGCVPPNLRAAVWPVLLAQRHAISALQAPLDGAAPEAASAAVEAVARAAYASASAGSLRSFGNGLAPEDAIAALAAAGGSDACPSALASLGHVLQAALTLPGLEPGEGAAALLRGLGDAVLGTWLRDCATAAAAASAGPSLPASAISLHEQLRALVRYRDPGLCSDLDAAHPLWHLPVAAAAPTALLAGEPSVADTSSGCVPAHWLLAGFAGPGRGVDARAVLPLWDRFLLWGALRRSRGSEAAADATAGFGALPSSSALRSGGGSSRAEVVAATGPPTPAVTLQLQLPLSAVTVACAAVLLLREGASLRALCGGSGGSGEAPPYLSGFDEGPRNRDGAADAGAAALIRSTVEAALRRFFQHAAASAVATAAAHDTSSEASHDPFAAGVAAWLDAASALLAATPASFWQGCVSAPLAPPAAGGAESAVPGEGGAAVAAAATDAAPAAEGAADAPLPPPSSSLGAAASALWGPSPRADGVARVSAAEVAAQVVFGHHRLVEALAAATARFRPPLFLLPGEWAEGAPAPVGAPAQLVVVDVRPLAHRAAGRLASAFHIDPRSCPAADDAIAAALAVGDDPHATAAAAGDGSAAAAASSQSGGAVATAAEAAAAGIPNPGTATGIPLLEAVTRLAPLSGAAHFAVLGVGARLIHRALPQAALAQVRLLGEGWGERGAARALPQAALAQVRLLGEGRGERGAARAVGAVVRGIRPLVVSCPRLLPPACSALRKTTRGLPRSSARSSAPAACA